MSMVPQEVLLFGGSIAENIAYGKPARARPRSREPPGRPTRTSLSNRFLNVMKPWSGDRGIKLLSGGQRQRVAIARGHSEKPGRSHPRRGDQLARFRKRTVDSGGLETLMREPDLIHHRPPPGDHSACGQDRGHLRPRRREREPTKRSERSKMAFTGARIASIPRDQRLETVEPETCTSAHARAEIFSPVPMTAICWLTADAYWLCRPEGQTHPVTAGQNPAPEDLRGVSPFRICSLLPAAQLTACSGTGESAAFGRWSSAVVACRVAFAIGR